MKMRTYRILLDAADPNYVVPTLPHSHYATGILATILACSVTATAHLVVDLVGQNQKDAGVTLLMSSGEIISYYDEVAGSIYDSDLKFDEPVKIHIYSDHSIPELYSHCYTPKSYSGGGFGWQPKLYHTNGQVLPPQ